MRLVKGFIISCISGTLTFHVRRRPADYQPRKRKKKPKPTKDDPNYNDNPSEKLPYLLELNPGKKKICYDSFYLNLLIILLLLLVHFTSSNLSMLFQFFDFQTFS